MKKPSMIVLVSCLFLYQSIGWCESEAVSASGSPTQEADANSESPESLNPEVRLDVGENVSKVFRDMVVVQRKAKNKARHILFNPNMGLDFSDGPATLYTMNLNFGYAVNDFWELYLNYVPGFLVEERGIVKMLGQLEVYDDPTNGQPQKITIDYAKPKSQLGAEVLWAPAYGKDSWGPFTMFRSDTFFKLGVYQVSFPEEKKTGSRFAFMGGKTYFVSKYFNLRFAVGLHHMQTFVGITEADRQKYNTIMFLEGGLVFYL